MAVFSLSPRSVTVQFIGYLNDSAKNTAKVKYQYITCRRRYKKTAIGEPAPRRLKKIVGSSRGSLGKRAVVKTDQDFTKFLV